MGEDEHRDAQTAGAVDVEKGMRRLQELETLSELVHEDSFLFQSK